ncbi:MAG: carboxylesterase family protein [Armatimonadota bacterium]
MLTDQPADVGGEYFRPPVDIVFLTKIDNSMQRYVEMLPSKYIKGKKYNVLIALHGHGSDRWQYIRDARDECRASRDTAGKHEMIFISPDYRATTSWMGPEAESDLLQIIRSTRRKYNIGKVFVTGASMGGSSSLTFAALHPDLIAGVASQNGTANHLEYENFQDAIRESFGGTKAEKPLEYKNRSPEYWPEKFTIPVAIAAGGKDELVPSGSVVRLANILKKIGRKVMLIYREEGGHSTDYADTAATIEFVIRNAAEETPDSE